MQPIYLATIAEDAPALARRYGLGLEIDEFCTAVNMDVDFDVYDARVRAHLSAAKGAIFHAPFAELCPCAVDPLVRDVASRRLKQAIDLCKRYGIRRMVVHSGFIPNVYFPIWFVEQGSAFFRELLSECGNDFEILIENVLDPDPQPLLDLVNAIGDPRVGVCLDVGHAHVVSKIPVQEWIDVLAPKLRHLHLHDNDGGYDTHSIPGDGTIGYPGLFAPLRTSAPQATMTFECIDAAGCVERLRQYGLLK